MVPDPALVAAVQGASGGHVERMEVMKAREGSIDAHEATEGKTQESPEMHLEGQDEQVPPMQVPAARGMEEHAGGETAQVAESSFPLP